MAKKNKPSKSLDIRTIVDEILRRLESTNIHAPGNVQQKKDIIADIEKILDEDIQQQIRNLSNPCLLLVGKDDIEAKLTACYAHSIRDDNLKDKKVDFRQAVSKPTSSFIQFKYKNCRYRYLVKHKESAKKWLDWFAFGHTVFLSRLRSEDINTCKEFAESIEEIKHKLANEHGLLIVNIVSKCHLPEYLRELFEPPIELEPDNIEVVMTRPITDVEKLKYISKAAVEPGEGYENIETVVVPVQEVAEATREDNQQEKKISKKKENRKKKLVEYNWRIENTRDVFCNGQHITTLPNLQFKLFKCLYKKPGTDIKNKTLEKCWGSRKPAYKNYLSTEMSKIGSKLKKGLEEKGINVSGNIIEPKKENGRNISYKLVTKP